MVSHWSFYCSKDSNTELIKKKMPLHNTDRCVGILKEVCHPGWDLGNVDVLRALKKRFCSQTKEIPWLNNCLCLALCTQIPNPLTRDNLIQGEEHGPWTPPGKPNAWLCPFWALGLWEPQESQSTLTFPFSIMGTVSSTYRVVERLEKHSICKA